MSGEVREWLSKTARDEGLVRLANEQRSKRVAQQNSAR